MDSLPVPSHAVTDAQKLDNWTSRRENCMYECLWSDPRHTSTVTEALISKFLYINHSLELLTELGKSDTSAQTYFTFSLLQEIMI